MRQRTAEPYGCSEVASLIAAHWITIVGSAACSADSRSRANVAMPHCRGGLVDTKAIDRLLDDFEFKWSGMAVRRRRLSAEPVQHVCHRRNHQAHRGIGRTIVDAQYTGWRVQ